MFGSRLLVVVAALSLPATSIAQAATALPPALQPVDGPPAAGLPPGNDVMDMRPGGAAAAEQGIQSATPSPSPPAQRHRMLVLALKSVDVDSAVAVTLQGIVAGELAAYPELDVLSGEDIKSFVQLQADRQLLGCSDDASCMSEVAEAMGAELVVFGSLGRLDEDLVVNVGLFDARRTTGLGRVVVQASSTRDMPKKLRPKIRTLVSRFYAEHGLTLPPIVEPEQEQRAQMEVSEDSGMLLPWAAVAAGGAVVIGGIVVASLGLVPYFRYADARGRIGAAEANHAEDPPKALNDAIAAQAVLQEAHAAWNETGFIMTDIGAGLAAVGLAVGGAGLVAVFSPREAMPAASASAAPQASSPITRGAAP